jgi:16S rRNA (uracil1498-N3)-methyltransferase
MSARRLFAAPLPQTAALLTLDPESRKHAQVLRLALGDAVCLFDAAGQEADGRIVRCERHLIECEVQPARQLPPPAARLTLVICLPKAAKLELIVRMATELGVHAVRLAHSERAIPKLSAESPKLERLRRIALEACAQSERAYAPELSGPLPLTAAAAAAPAHATKLVFWERCKQSLALERSAAGEPRDVWAVIGPEGGLAPHEVQQLQAQGYLAVGLGSGILRVETACVVACALVLDRLALLA